MYKPKYFELYELLPKDFYQKFTHREGYLWGIFDDRALWTLDQIRHRFGTVQVNNWKWGGNNQYGGFRPFDCPIGAELSQHKFGRAFDAKSSDVSAEEIRQDIRKNPDRGEYKHITCIENKVSWFHFDTRNYDVSQKGILFFNP